MRKIAVLLFCICLVGCASLKKNTPAKFEGGDGTSKEKAVIIIAADEPAGVEAEYQWLSVKYPGYQLKSQLLLKGENNKSYDLFIFKMPDGVEHKIYFDISSFLGKR